MCKGASHVTDTGHEDFRGCLKTYRAGPRNNCTKWKGKESKKQQFSGSEQWKQAKWNQASKQNRNSSPERQLPDKTIRKKANLWLNTEHSLDSYTAHSLLWLFSTFYSNSHQNWKLIAKTNLKIVILFIISMQTPSLLKRRVLRWRSDHPESWLIFIFFKHEMYQYPIESLLWTHWKKSVHSF